MAASFDESTFLTLTENKSAATFSSSADPCIDFFFQINTDTPSSKITSLLTEAWKQDPLTALKLVFHLRGVRGTGKSNKEAFYTCFSWLQQYHPKSLLANLHLVPKFGYYKDLLEVVLREIGGGASGRQKSRSTLGRKRDHRAVCAGGVKPYWARKGEAARQAKKDGVLQDREVRIALSLEQGKVNKEMASQLRKQKRAGMALRIQTKLKENPEFASLHDAVAEIFVKQLLADKKALEAKKYFDISFSAKWCPSLKKSFDLRTGLHHAIASRLFNKDEFVHLDEERRALAVVDKMRKEFLVPLRQALEVPEIYMSSNRWSELPYERVPSVAMSNQLDDFIKHDNDRYLKFLENVADGKKKVAAGALLPHKVAKEAVQGKGKPKGDLAEVQWKRMVSDLQESGSKLSGVLAIYMGSNNRVPSVGMSNHVYNFIKHDNDRYLKFPENVAAGKEEVATGALLPHKVAKEAVQATGKPKLGALTEVQWKRRVSILKKARSLAVSDSMSSTPCIALGLLVAELCEEPFKDHLCTFSSSSLIHLVEGDTLAERYKFTEGMKWGMNTDFRKVFHNLLDRALASKLPKEKMVKRLFVFSDTEFNEALANPWETDYLMITKMYEEAGYGEPPEILFWNLRDSKSTPVVSNQKGVALVSGFSKNLLKVFLDENAEELEVASEEQEQKKDKPTIDPKEVMMKALTGDFFEDIKVVD